MRFTVRGEELPIEPTLNKLQDPDETVRKDASDALARTFKANLRTFTLITNTLAKDKEISDRWRGFEDVEYATLEWVAWFNTQRLLEPLHGRLEVPARLFGLPQVDERGEVVLVRGQDAAKLGDRARAVAGVEVRLGQPPARVGIRGILAQALAQLADEPVVEAGVEVGDLQVALGNLHLGVDGQRPLELGDGLLVHPLVEVEDAQVVVRARVGRVDALGEAAEDAEVPLRVGRPGGRFGGGGFRHVKPDGWIAG